MRVGGGGGWRGTEAEAERGHGIVSAVPTKGVRFEAPGGESGETERRRMRIMRCRSNPSLATEPRSPSRGFDRTRRPPHGPTLAGPAPSLTPTRVRQVRSPPATPAARKGQAFEQMAGLEPTTSGWRAERCPFCALKGGRQGGGGGAGTGRDGEHREPTGGNGREEVQKVGKTESESGEEGAPSHSAGRGTW